MLPIPLYIGPESVSVKSGIIANKKAARLGAACLIEHCSIRLHRDSQITSGGLSFCRAGHDPRIKNRPEGVSPEPARNWRNSPTSDLESDLPPAVNS